MSFAPGAADAGTWRMGKLGSPVGPREVIANGSFSQHSVGDEGVAVRAAGVQSWEALNIRQGPYTTLTSPMGATQQCAHAAWLLLPVFGMLHVICIVAERA